MNQESSEHPKASLSRRPPEPIRVGEGTAFFLQGTVDLGEMVLEHVALEFAGRNYPVEIHNGVDWSAMVVIDGEAPGEEVAVNLLVTGSGGEAALDLGLIRLGHGRDGLPGPVAFDQSGGGEPLIAICMATYEPLPDRLARQLDSIRAQTRQGWICVISDDCSGPEARAELERQTAGDPRFVVSRSAERLGFLRNFERAIALVPPSANLISLADQDDRWDPDKLEVLVSALSANPASRLAYSDVRIADGEGNILSDTYWFERRNSYDSMASMMIANNVTGAAAMFRRELLDLALPFPPSGTGQEVYHDHWLALCALATGPLTYVDRPTHDYTRHDLSVTVRENDGEWVVPPQNRREDLLMRWRRFTRRLSLTSRGPRWRSAYLGRYMLIRQLATILELRLGRAAIEPRHRRDLDRLLAAEGSPRAAGWLLARSFRPWIGRNETLSRERVIFGGIAWHKLATRRARR